MAQFNLALMYQTGRGVTADLQKAIRGYRRAAKRGDAKAPENLRMGGRKIARVQHCQRVDFPSSTITSVDRIFAKEPHMRVIAGFIAGIAISTQALALDLSSHGAL